MVKRRRKVFLRWARILVYGSLTIGLIDYFFVHPSLVTPDQLKPAESELHPLVERLRGHVEFLASPELLGRAPGTPGNVRAEHYLIDQFRAMGLVAPSSPGKITQTISKQIGNNVFSALPPVDPETDWFLLGAHFDHLGRVDGEDFLGADDNASSVAILLETARLLVESGGLRRSNLLFVGFNSEEPPYIDTRWMGSQYFYSHMEEVGIDRKRLRLAVIMDLMGGVFWKPLTDVVFAMGAEKSSRLESVVHSITIPKLEVWPLGMHMVENIPGVGKKGFSDYMVFRDHDVPHLFLSAGRTPHYHRPTDTAEKLHYARMARTVLWLVQMLQAVDGLGTPLDYDSRREDYMQDLKVMKTMLGDAATWRTKIPQTGLITLVRLKKDRRRMAGLDEKNPGRQTFSENDVLAMRLASVRLQCLQGNMGPCFLIESPPE